MSSLLGEDAAPCDDRHVRPADEHCVAAPFERNAMATKKNAPSPDEQAEKQPTTPTFLHSPPDSNNANKSNASDSELSDLDEEPTLDDPLQIPSTEPSWPASDCQPQPEQDSGPPVKGMGDVLPDHWETGVPVFKPSMAQFEDFKLFVRLTGLVVCSANPD